jgi:peptidoglycan/xylan/chitin deacetylase (PgdA/CDA1 family)
MLSQPWRRPTRRTQMACHRPQSLAIPHWLTTAIVLLLVCPFGCPQKAHADAPQRNQAFVPPARTVTNRSVCIDPGNDGRCFTLADLRERASKWRIPPPVWNKYPAALDKVPLVGRTYAPETIAYLAAHRIRYGDPGSKTIALTFDCEIRPALTMDILETLRQERVHATFFVQGKFAYQNPDVIRRMVADGHELGSHSFFHPLFTDLTPLEMTREMTYTEAAIAWAVGEYVPMRYFRFPYAGENDATRRHVASLGYQSSAWDIDPRGWDPQNTAQDVVENVRQAAHAGGTIIMHCGSVDDLRALPQILRVIRDRGLKPGTVTDVLKPEDRDVPGYQLLPQP